MVVVSGAQPVQQPAAHIGNVSNLMLPPGLQRLAQQTVDGTLPPGLQLLAEQANVAPKPEMKKPRLAPRPALNSAHPASRSDPTAVRAPRIRAPGPSAFLGSTLPAHLSSIAPPSSGFVGAPTAGMLGIAAMPQSRPTRKLGAVLRELKGLPAVDANSAQDITDAWLSVAGLTASGDSSSSARGEGSSASTALPVPEPKASNAEVMKALRAAAATNKGEPLSSDNQLKSWLALAANDANDVANVTAPVPEFGPQEVTGTSNGMDGSRSVVAIHTAIDVPSIPNDSVRDLVQQATSIEMTVKSAEEARMSAARASEAAAAVALAAKATAAAAAAAAVVQPPSTTLQLPSVTPGALQHASGTQGLPAQEVTGIDMLKALAETQTAEREADGVAPEAKRAAGGYAMVSMMHRAAENAKANMKSRMAAAERLLSDGKPSNSEEAGAAGAQAVHVGYMYLGRIPKGTGEGLLLAECTKYGTVSSLHYDAKAADIIEGGFALVKFAKQESVTVAVSRMSRRSGLFGATDVVEVRPATPEDMTRAEEQRRGEHAPAKDEKEIGAGVELPSSADPYALLFEVPTDPKKNDVRPHENREHARRTGHSHSDRHEEREKHRKKSDKHHDRDRRRRRDSREERDDRSRRKRSRSPRGTADSEGSDSSASDGGGGASVTVPPAAPIERKVRGLGGFGDTPAAEAAARVLTSGFSAPAGHPDEPSGGRQVGVRGCWAEFATPDNRSYYVNIINGAKQWSKPIGFDNSTKTGAAITRSSASAKAATGIGHSNIFVGSLPHGFNEIAFRQLFEPYGRIVTMKVVPEQRYGFVKYSNVTEAQKAIDVLNGQSLTGIPLIVKFANMDRSW